MASLLHRSRSRTAADPTATVPAGEVPVDRREDVVPVDRTGSPEMAAGGVGPVAEPAGRVVTPTRVTVPAGAAAPGTARAGRRSGTTLMRPTGAAFTGLLALVVGAWAALATYLGPYFDFKPVSNGAWTATLQSGLLHLLPGAVAAAAGLLLMAVGPARRAAGAGALLLPAVALIAAGAWLVVGPTAWPVMHSGPAFHTGVSDLRNLLNVACSSLAPGLVLTALGGMAAKTAVTRPVTVIDTRDGGVPVEGY